MAFWRKGSGSGDGGDRPAGRPVDGAATSVVTPERPDPGATEPRTPFQAVEAGLAATARWAIRLLVVIAAAVLLGFGVSAIWTVVFPLLLALLLSTILWPPARFLRRFMPAALAALLTVVGFLAAITALFGFLIPQVAREAGELGSSFQDGITRIQELLAQPPFNLDSDRIGDLLDDLVSRIQENGEQIAQGVLTGVSGIGSFLIGLVLTLVLTFFLLKDGTRFVPWVGAWIGPEALAHAGELCRRIWTALGGFIWSQAAVALVDAVFIGLGLWLLDVPLALPLAVLIFFAAFIPIVGAVSTGALAVLIAVIAHDFTRGLLVLALVLVVQQLESNVLQPMLVGRTLTMHPAVVLSAVTIGGTLSGIAGAFLAVPLVAVSTVVARYAREKVRGQRPETGGGDAPEPAAVPDPGGADGPGAGRSTTTDDDAGDDADGAAVASGAGRREGNGG